MILYIHRVLDSVRTGWAPDRDSALTIEEFENLLDRYGSVLANWDEVCGQEQSGGVQQVALTFDDGFSDFLEISLPRLEAAGRKVLVFVVAGFADGFANAYEYLLSDLLRRVDTLVVPDSIAELAGTVTGRGMPYRFLTSRLKTLSPKNRRQALRELALSNGFAFDSLVGPQALNWEQLRELQRHRFVELGVHSMTHAYLPSCSWKDLFREILLSKALIEGKLGHAVRCFAYPYGASSLFGRLLVRASGFRFAFSTEMGDGSRFNLRRENVRTHLGGSAE
jgi:peptidoglycan/xylan/chitin deacetylase (PgdA/CDA1 family)